MTYTFVGSLFYLLALNLWNAGEITYEVSNVSKKYFQTYYIYKSTFKFNYLTGFIAVELYVLFRLAFVSIKQTST